MPTIPARKFDIINGDRSTMIHELSNMTWWEFETSRVLVSKEEAMKELELIYSPDMSNSICIKRKGIFIYKCIMF